MGSAAQRRPTVVAPGNYDGVHLGHRSLLAQVRAEATRVHGTATCMFFDPHPAELLSPERAPLRLTSPARRVELLTAAGADTVVVQPFDRDFSAATPEMFVRDVLVHQLGATCVVVGPDFRFGRERCGDIATLEALGAPLGLTVVVVPPTERDGERVSSTRIRGALSNGDATQAAALLGRYHDVLGRVVHGQARGRQLGFPTANMAWETVMLPEDGVYAVMVQCPAARWTLAAAGVANLGSRPTVGAGRALEVHLLDFEGDLYDCELRVAFVARLRGERRFDGLDSLKAQISIDVQQGRAVLAQSNPEFLRWL